MSDFDRLKQMDPEEIYQKTFMLPKVIKALLEEDFEKLGNKTKVLGFVAILERELGLDLGELREKIADHFEKNSVEYTKAFEITEKSQRGFSFFWILLVIGALAAAGAYLYFSSEEPKEQKNDFLASKSGQEPSSSSSSVSAFLESNLSSSSSSSSVQEERNESREAAQEENLSVIVTEENESVSSSSETLPPSLTLIPKRKLWVGIVSLDDYSRKNYVTSSPIEINTSKDQLIVTGHGVLKFDVNGEIKEYNSKDKLYFIYRAGELEQIDKRSFKLYNRGKNW